MRAYLLSKNAPNTKYALSIPIIARPSSPPDISDMWSQIVAIRGAVLQNFLCSCIMQCMSLPILLGRDIPFYAKYESRMTTSKDHDHFVQFNRIYCAPASGCGVHSRTAPSIPLACFGRVGIVFPWMKTEVAYMLDKIGATIEISPLRPASVQVVVGIKLGGSAKSFFIQSQSTSRRKEAERENIMHPKHDNLSSSTITYEWRVKSADSLWKFLALGSVPNIEVLTMGIVFVLAVCVLFKAIGSNLEISSSVRDGKGNAIPNGPIGLPLIGKPTNIHLIYLFTYIHTVQDRSPS